MRRKDREITDIDEIIKIVSDCDVLHLGMSDNNMPYVVPVNFGFSHKEGILTFYIHCATTGKKIDILKSNPQVFLQLDCRHQVILGSLQKPCAFSFAYASVMAKSRAQFIEDTKEKSIALNHIIAHTAKSNTKYEFPLPMLNKTCVIAFKAEDLSAKAHNIN